MKLIIGKNRDARYSKMIFTLMGDKLFKEFVELPLGGFLHFDKNKWPFSISPDKYIRSRFNEYPKEQRFSPKMLTESTITKLIYKPYNRSKILSAKLGK